MLFDGLMSKWRKRSAVFKDFVPTQLHVKTQEGDGPKRVVLTFVSKERGVSCIVLEPDQALCLGIEIEQAAHWLKRGPKGQ